MSGALERNNSALYSRSQSITSSQPVNGENANGENLNSHDGESSDYGSFFSSSEGSRPVSQIISNDTEVQGVSTLNGKKRKGSSPDLEAKVEPDKISGHLSLKRSDINSAKLLTEYCNEKEVAALRATLAAEKAATPEKSKKTKSLPDPLPGLFSKTARAVQTKLTAKLRAENKSKIREHEEKSKFEIYCSTCSQLKLT